MDYGRELKKDNGSILMADSVIRNSNIWHCVLQNVVSLSLSGKQTISFDQNKSVHFLSTLMTFRTFSLTMGKISKLFLFSLEMRTR